MTVNPYVATVGMLMLSNLFMAFAWYAHLKNLADKPWFIAALVSWGIALAEYLLQEVITLAVFVPFAVLYMREPVTLDFLWAALCLVGAAYFMFR